MTVLACYGIALEGTLLCAHCGCCLQPQFGMQKDLGAPEPLRSALQSSQGCKPHFHQDRLQALLSLDSFRGQQLASPHPPSGNKCSEKEPYLFLTTLAPSPHLEVSPVSQVSSLYLGDKKVNPETRSQSEGGMTFPKGLFPLW